MIDESDAKKIVDIFVNTGDGCMMCVGEHIAKARAYFPYIDWKSILKPIWEKAGNDIEDFAAGFQID